MQNSWVSITVWVLTLKLDGKGLMENIDITGMLSWIPQATNSFLEKLTSGRSINGFIQKDETKRY